MFDFSTPKARRRPGLTPMIDVVFLLLIFFLLASRFGSQGALPIEIGAGGDTSWNGPPRIVDVAPSGLRLNGVPVAETDLAQRLRPLLSNPDDTVLLRPGGDVDLQRLVEIIQLMEAAGYTGISLVAEDG